MAKSLFTRLLVLLLLSIPNQPVALVEAESSLSCSAEEFACHDQSKCIPSKYLCDGDNDCSDHSDEQICEECVHKDLFACHDKSKCIPKSKMCNGYDDCADNSHNIAAQCNDCASEDLFKCQNDGKEVCNANEFKCDGLLHCTDHTDELLTECGPECPGTKFQCRVGGRQVCLDKDYYLCDSRFTCDDASDEDPSACDMCNKPGLFMCRDGSQCIKSNWRCDGYLVHCADGSDEADSECGVCAQEGAVRCPGFPDNCGVPCDGMATCPDNWDEFLSTCEAYNVPCTEEAGLYKCTDGSMCLAKEQLCESVKDCFNGEDETAIMCRDICQSHRSKGYPLHWCDGGSCVVRGLLCSTRNESVPLCNDRSDMNVSLCDPDQTGERKCFTDFVRGLVDPYRWMCEDGSKCILRTDLCNNNPDCPDGSDERQGCPWYVKLDLFYTLLICLALVTLSLLLHFGFKAWSCSLSQSSSSSDQGTQSSEVPPRLEEPPLESDSPSTSDRQQTELDFIKHDSESNPSGRPSSEIVPAENSSLLDHQTTPSPPPTPSFLLHPALSDLEGEHWSWQDVGKELKIEVVFFNRDNKFLESFLSQIEAQDAHPDTVHKVFKGLFCHLEAEGLNRDAVAVAMRQSIGHHRLAHLALKGPPNVLDKWAYQLKKQLDQLENRTKVGFVCIKSIKTIQSSIPPFLYYLDMVKDFVLFKILYGTIERLAEGCQDLSTCLAATPAEENLMTAMLVVFIFSLVLTSLHAWFQRHHFFKTNRLFSFVLFVSSPFLPAVYQLEIASICQTLMNQKKTLSNQEYQNSKKKIKKLTDIVQQSKSIEVGLEAISQILILCGLATFYDFVFKAPSGQTYSYFYGVALLVLKGNAQLFIASILISFVGPTLFFLNNENHKRHSSFNVMRKIILLLRNMFLMLARLGAIVTAIFIPVIKEWDVFIGNKGVDAADRFDFGPIELEFNRHFSRGLQAVSDDITKNSLYLLGFILLHMLVVAIHGVVCSPKFGTSTMRERLLHLVSSFWLPLPFLTIRGVDRGEEKAELWFGIGLHTCENLLMLLVSRWVYLGGYPLGLFLVQISLLTLNIIALMVSLVKKKKKQGSRFVWFYLLFFVALNLAAAFLPRLFSDNFLPGFLLLDFSIVTFNILGVVVAYIYTKKFELYADIPDIHLNLPSFGPEDVLVGPVEIGPHHHHDRHHHQEGIRGQADGSETVEQVQTFKNL